MTVIDDFQSYYDFIRQYTSGESFYDTFIKKYFIQNVIRTSHTIDTNEIIIEYKFFRFDVEYYDSVRLDVSLLKPLNTRGMVKYYEVSAHLFYAFINNVYDYCIRFSTVSSWEFIIDNRVDYTNKERIMQKVVADLLLMPDDYDRKRFYKQVTHITFRKIEEIRNMMENLKPVNNDWD